KSIRYSYTPAPTPLALDKLPCWMRARAAATLAAASLFKRSDQAANGLRPLRSRYSRTSTIINGNTYGTNVNRPSHRHVRAGASQRRWSVHVGVVCGGRFDRGKRVAG